MAGFKPNPEDTPPDAGNPLPEEPGRLGAGREPDDGLPPDDPRHGWGGRPGRGPAGSGDEAGGPVPMDDPPPPERPAGGEAP